MSAERDGLDANPQRLVAFEAARSALFFLPAFFLYFERALPVSQVLALEAIYYLAGTLLEVPSGFASDRLGRRAALLAAAGLQAIGAGILFWGSDFATFAIGQALLAGSWSFVSGTDTALLYESLVARDRAAESLRWETLLQRAGLIGLALSAILGGFLARISLAAGYAATAASSLVALFLATRLREAPRTSATGSPRLDVRGFLGQLREPWLRFGLAIAIAGMVFNHVPFEFLQPILRDALAGANLDQESETPLFSGLVLGSTMALGALVSGRVPALARRLGTARTLLLAHLLQTAAICVLAFVAHPIAAVVLLLRSVPQALTRPVLRSALHPRLAGDWRATWFSAQSFVAQSAFGAVLIASSIAVGDLDRLEGDELRRLLAAFGIAAVLTLVPLLLLVPRGNRD